MLILVYELCGRSTLDDGNETSGLQNNSLALVQDFLELIQVFLLLRVALEFTSYNADSNQTLNIKSLSWFLFVFENVFFRNPHCY